VRFSPHYRRGRQLGLDQDCCEKPAERFPPGSEADRHPADPQPEEEAEGTPRAVHQPEHEAGGFSEGAGGQNPGK